MAAEAGARPGASGLQRERYHRWLRDIKTYNAAVRHAWECQNAAEQEHLFEAARSRMAPAIERERKRNHSQGAPPEVAVCEHARRAWLLAAGWDTAVLDMAALPSVPNPFCPDPFECLGLKRTGLSTDAALVRKRFRKLALMFHPDKNCSDKANTAFCAFSAAYRNLLQLLPDALL